MFCSPLNTEITQASDAKLLSLSGLSFLYFYKTAPAVYSQTCASSPVLPLGKEKSMHAYLIHHNFHIAV